MILQLFGFATILIWQTLFFPNSTKNAILFFGEVVFRADLFFWQSNQPENFFGNHQLYILEFRGGTNLVNNFICELETLEV